MKQRRETNWNVSLLLIAGPSCSGKTTISEALVDRLADAALFPLDAYYRDLSHLSQVDRDRANVDIPEALEWPLVLRDVEHYLSGEGVALPTYDYAAHTRLAETAALAPAHWLVVEGLFALRPELLERARLSVYIDADEALCLERRLTRDVRDRGRDADYVRQQFEEKVWPMAMQHVLPNAGRADMALPGDAPVAESIARILATLE